MTKPKECIWDQTMYEDEDNNSKSMGQLLYGTRFRLGEDKILEEFENYISKTYSQHYAGGKKDSRQTIEAIIDRGHGEGFCIGNAMKYLERYGFKNGKNRDDLMKAMHYCLLAIINHDKIINK